MTDGGRADGSLDGAGTQRAVKRVVPGVTEALVPEVTRDRSESVVRAGQWRVRHGVELVAGIITAEDHLPRSPILGRDSNIIKININMVIFGKFIHGDNIFD